MRPRVKICGIADYEDAALALELGADAVGFVMAPSPRRIEPDEAALILERLRSAGLLGPASRGAVARGAVARGAAARREAVCVFVNEDPETMSRIVSTAGFDWAQVHGDETPEECRRFAFPWYRALRASAPEPAASMAALPWDCPRLLFDAAAAGAYGGTGRSVPLAVAVAARDAARGAGKAFYLAGGLGPSNVAAAIAALRPDGIDVASGVEERPGKKSREAMQRLFAEIARAAGGGEG